MVEITENGKKALRLIFTDFSANYNSNNIREKIKLSNAGSLKLLRSLEKKGVLVSHKMGNAIFYKPPLENSYFLKLMELIFLDNSNLSSFVKGWIYDISTLAPYTYGILLFGSILRKGKEANDVDVCLILKKGEDYNIVESKIKSMNEQNRLKIHPLYLTRKELEKKLKEKDKPLVDMVKTCVVVHGQSLFVEVLKNVQS